MVCPIPSAATVIGPFTRTKGIPFTLVLYLLKKPDFLMPLKNSRNRKKKSRPKEEVTPLG